MSLKDSHILIVEDNQTMRKMLEVIVSDLGYRHYSTAVNGLKAWEIIQEGGVDLILCDYLMPEMNGLELLRLVRKSKQFYRLPFIVVSGADQRGDFMKTVQAEVDFYIIKPPNSQILGDLIDQALKIKYYPGDYVKTIYKGKYLFLNEKYDKALEQFILASQARNDIALPYYYIGLIYQKLQNEKKAELNFKKSLIIENQFISSILSLAEIYTSRDDNVNLAHYLSQAADILSDAFDVHIGLAHACIQTGEIDRANRHFEEALPLAKNNRLQIKEIIDGYIEAGLVDKADDLFGRKLEDDNVEKTIHFLNKLGLRAKKDGHFGKAKNFYLNCIKLDNQNKIANFNLAKLLVTMRDFEGAQSYLKKLHRLYPDFKEATELITALEERFTDTL